MTEKILAVIPARIGSKGILKKNLHLLKDKPLVDWTIQAACDSCLFDEIILSSDSNEILERAEKYGISKELRNKNLAQDNTKTIEVVLDILKNRENFKTLFILQPTSPLRTKEDILAAFKAYSQDKESDSLISVVEEERDVQKYLSLNDRYLKGLVNNELPFMPRQELPSVFRANGAIYIVDVEMINIEKKLLTKKTIPYIMKKSNSIDIDCLNDIFEAEKILSYRAQQ